MESKSNNKLQNPLTQYYAGSYEIQQQEWPGLQSEMHPKPDCGEKSYCGCNKLQGRKALVTGGDSGIGRAAAIAYAREGADVAINYFPSEQSDAEEVAAYIEEAGQKAFLIPGDVSDENFCKQMVEEAYRKLGGLDIVTLVAGKQVAVKNFEDISTEQIKKTFETNVFSLFWILQPALKYMPAGSTIITTTSIQAYQPSEILIDYASTKSAIMAFTRALAKQLAPRGIRANAVAPGPIWTALQVSGGQLPERLTHFGQSTPLKRAGQPAELAGVYVFLASSESSYVTAEVYGVTGGNHTF